MGIAKANTGSFDVFVITLNNDGERYVAAQEYSIDMAGVHLLALTGEQYFIPHWNIRKLEINKHETGGDWK